MREYFVFKLNNVILSIYKDHPRYIFAILNRIYYTKYLEKDMVYNYFLQLADPINKESLDEYIYSLYEDKIYYSKTEKEHIINNLYYNEISILEAKCAFIKINTNTNSSFFKNLRSYDSNFFVCDFKNQEYFFITRIKTLV